MPVSTGSAIRLAACSDLGHRHKVNRGISISAINEGSARAAAIRRTAPWPWTAGDDCRQCTCVRYLCAVPKANAARSIWPGQAARLAAHLAADGAATVLASWAVGRLMQRDFVVQPSRQLYEYVRARRSTRVAHRLDQAVTTVGDYSVIVPFSVLVGGLVAYERRDWAPLPLLLGGLMSEVYLQKALKNLVKGSKPPQEYSVGPPGDFPSGGAARTVITFGLLAHLLAERWTSPAERRAVWAVALGLVAAQGGSRLYLGRHWPEDVLGGWLFGWFILRALIKTTEATRPGSHI